MNKKRVLLVWLFLLTSGLSCFSQGQTAVSAADEAYFELVNSAAQGEELDFTDLRNGYTQTSFANGFFDVRKEFEPFIEKDDYLGALKLIRENFYSWVALIDFCDYAIYIYQKLEGEESDNAAFFAYIGQELITSILASGDGLSEQTAFKVINAREEHFIAGFLGYEVESQELKEDNSEYTVLKCTKDGETVLLYFDISSFFK